MNCYSDKAIRTKSLDKMNEAEQALLELEIKRAVEGLKSKYSGEGNTLLGIAKLLRDEAGRIINKDISYQENI